MGGTYLGLLYREGSEETSDTIYHLRMKEISIDEESQSGWVFVRRYDHLTTEQLNALLKEVSKHKGSQKTLLDKINKIVPPEK